MNTIKKTKIVATLGPATFSKEVIEKMILAGVNVFRINFSHANYNDVSERIQMIRKVDEKLNTNTAILADLQGPKLRVGKIEEGTEINQILPAAGQGIIAVQCNKDDAVIKNFLQKIDDQESNFCAKAEKKMLQVIGGDCKTAVGGLALIKDKKLTLTAQLFSDKGDQNFNYNLSGNCKDAERIGEEAGNKLLSLAGKNFKKK